jgi:hypothetical protein
VDLSEIEVIATERDEGYDEYSRTGYVDTQTGAVHIVYRQTFRCLEEETDPEELDEWAQTDLDVAEAILSDTEGRFEEIERWDSSEEYELMEEFAEASRNPRLREQLFQALNQRKPFRHFGDVLIGWPEAREAWFSYRDHRHRDWIRDWLNRLGIEPTDTSSYRPKPLPDRW